MNQADVSKARAEFMAWFERAAAGEEQVDLSELTTEMIVDLLAPALTQLVQGMVFELTALDGGPGLQDKKFVTGAIMTYVKALGPNKSLIAFQLQALSGQAVLDSPEAVETFRDHMTSSLGSRAVEA